jgi:hypothetical protein
MPLVRLAGTCGIAVVSQAGTVARLRPPCCAVPRVDRGEPQRHEYKNSPSGYWTLVLVPLDATLPPSPWRTPPLSFWTGLLRRSGGDLSRESKQSLCEMREAVGRVGRALSPMGG